MFQPLIFSLLVSIAGFGIRANAEYCPPYGCPLLPFDLSSDGPAVDALDILRKTLHFHHAPEEGEEETKNNNRNSDETAAAETILKQKEDALSILQRSGDESKTTMTLTGYKGRGQQENQINQDRAMIISPYHITPTIHSATTASTSTTIQAQLLGVFDGHGTGGELTSQYAIEQVPKRLAEKLAAIGDTILENEEAVSQSLKDVFMEVDQTDPSKGEGGCTATVVLQLGKKIFVANAGDSISFIGVYFHGGQQQPEQQSDESQHQLQRQVQIVYQSREDKPDLPEERARITAAGGYVHIPNDPNQDVPRAYHIDKDGNPRWGLAMSRSLGDWSVQGVIAEPIVDVLDVHEIVKAALASHAETCNASIDDVTTNEGEQFCKALDPRDVHIFAVSASDGMMDEISPDYIGEVFAKAFFDPTSGLHPHSAAESLVLTAAKGWYNAYRGGYRDDIAVAALAILSDNLNL